MTYEELIKILLSDNVYDLIKEIESEIFKLIPELETCKGFDQKNKWHIYDVYEHILHVLSNTENNIILRLAALFHDIGKPITYKEDESGQGHFMYHWEESVKIFEKYQSDFDLSEEEKELIKNLIFYHDINVDKMDDKEKSLMIKRIGISNISLLFDLKRADLLSQSPEYISLLDNIDRDENNILLKREEFKKEMFSYEISTTPEEILIKMGSVPILFSSPHAVNHYKDDGSIKYGEPYTKAINLYLNKVCDTYSIIKAMDDGYDSNKDNHDKYKEELLRIVKENNIKLVIDLHGASYERDFDVEFGTLNNLTADFSTIKELEEAFIENGIKNISHNEPFMGGAITQYLFNLKDVDVIQLEINKKYRDIENVDYMQSLVNSFIDFINQYIDYTNR